jgi:aminocarboxymuconate-semialdehyde decarboxylase
MAEIAMDTIRLHLCGPDCGPYCQQAEQARQAVAARDRRSPVIDMHCHVFVPAVEQQVAGHPLKQAEDEANLAASGADSVRHNREQMLPAVVPRLLEPQVRLADMDAMGVDIQLLSPAPSQYYYWADETLAEVIVTLQNEAIHALCQQYPQRFVGLGAVALQYPQLAARQLEVVMKELGLKGVEICTHVGDLELGSEQLWPFWEKAEQLGAVVFIHPFGSQIGTRLVPYYLSNLIGQPLETTLALSHLMFSGTFDRFPKLKILAAHGGGYLPLSCGRSDQGRKVRPEAGGSEHLPSQYLKNLWFDSLLFSPQALRHLIDQVGIGQVVVGTDYPFDMGAFDIHRLIREVPGLSAEDQHHLLSGNAMRLLGMNDPVASAATQWLDPI